MQTRLASGDSPDNKKNLYSAKQEFETVLAKDPTNAIALTSIASLAYNSASFGTSDEKAAAPGYKADLPVASAVFTPEPRSVALLGIGIVAFGLTRLRRRI